MKKILMTLFLCSIFTVITSLNSPTNLITAKADKAIPSYAKWGKIAIKKTKEEYPNAKIYDYLHVKRQQKGQYSIETFKLWLSENNNKFEVMVHIKFETTTERILNVSIQKNIFSRIAAPIPAKTFSHIVYYYTEEGILYNQQFQRAFEQLERPDMIKCKISLEQNGQESEVIFGVNNVENENGKQLHAHMKRHINDLIKREKSNSKKVVSIRVLELSYEYNEREKEKPGGEKEIDILFKGLKDTKIKKFNKERREKILKEFFNNR
ncbi:DUF3889 domain-containing protein [Priestia megaterium]|uniref:DUF3889 domain-containing protein n=1 Tax=Priestia megaterium TaxID=1404 RepID=UPI001951551F|nr:DUF3889 domain-containing protein [Priestia megaterium]MBM6601944.1 DUF3889 domain-containing protein [Priestia megaterium]